MRTIRVHVYKVPPGAEDQGDNSLVRVDGDTYQKILGRDIGWVKIDDSEDGKIISRFALFGKLPEGVRLEYQYESDRRGY